MKLQRFFERLSVEFFTYFRLIIRTFGIMALTIFDVTISGVSLYIILKDTPEIPGAIAAGTVSLALTSISIYFWQELQRNRVRSAMSVSILIIVLLLQVIDLYIDLSIMEMIYGTKDIMQFLTVQSRLQVPRPPMWWALFVTFGILTIVNEPLVAQMVNNKPKTGQNQPKNNQKVSYSEHNVQNRAFRTQQKRSEQNSLDPNVLTWIGRYRSEHDGKFPAYRKVVQNTSLTSTSQVAPYKNHFENKS